jgi:hypothetical protein
LETVYFRQILGPLDLLAKAGPRGCTIVDLA